jgi:pyruvate-ferredoxin/flavodoxin oxidoreductase
MARQKVTIDANEAVAYVAYRMNEVIALFPITPSSPMGEHSDEWAPKGVKNLWGTVPSIMEMQSEGGAAELSMVRSAQAHDNYFTASQGLLLMIPNMYKIAGELTSTVFHVTAALCSHALSIFGDQSDVMQPVRLDLP